MDESDRCRARVRDGGICQRRGAVWEKGTYWCRTHAPSAVLGRETARRNRRNIRANAMGVLMIASGKAARMREDFIVRARAYVRGERQLHESLGGPLPTGPLGELFVADRELDAANAELAWQQKVYRDTFEATSPLKKFHKKEAK